MSASKPYFSIIIPSYNQGKYLEAAIRSVVSQSVTDWELLILDGGSTDKSVKIIRQYARKYPKKIYWRSHQDRGQVAAINEGLSRAKGEVVAYINSDDHYLPRVFAVVKQYFEKNLAKKWLVGNCRCSDKTLDLTFKFKELVPFSLWPKLLFIGNFINQPAVFMRRDLVKKIGRFDENYHYAFDYDYWLRCLKKTKPGRLKKNLAVFRIHPQSKGNTGYKSQLDEDYRISVEHCNYRLINSLHWLMNLGIKSIYGFLK